MRKFKADIFFMSQYQSFFISAGGNSSQCDELNHFLRSHVIIRTIENNISTGNNCGIQILVEYKDIGVSNQQDKKNIRIDWRASLANDEQRAIFDKLKEVRLNLAKSKKLKAAYLVCKDEHLALIIQKPNITEEEIKKFPNSGNIMLKEFAHSLYEEYQKILKENSENLQNNNVSISSDNIDELSSLSLDTKHNEENQIPF